jgi:DNA-binding transcriptional LysR family regulator
MRNKIADRQQEVSRLETIPADLSDLRAFCFVVDLGSITAAAKQLGETKGSVSRRLARLEKALGSSLVRRSPRLVQPTEDGITYRQRVGRVLELLEEATEELLQARAAPHGQLRVTAPQDLATRIIAPTLARFGERYPHIQVELVLTEKALDFDANQIDIALRATAGLRDSSLIAHRLMDLDHGFVASPEYLKRHRAPRTPAELEEHRILLMRAMSGPLPLARQGSDEKPTRMRLEPDVVAQDGAFIREVAIAGAGIALLPLILIEEDLSAKRLVRVLPEHRLDIQVGLYLLHASMQFIPPKVRAFREFITEELRGRAGRGR